MAGRPPFDVFSAESEDIKSYLSAILTKNNTLNIYWKWCLSSLKGFVIPKAPNMKTFDQLATLLRGHYKSIRLKVAQRYRFHSANQKPG